MEKNDYKKTLLSNGVLGFVTHGHSMWPFIKNKKTSVIVLKKEDRLSVYDVGFYQRKSGEYVLHRVIEVTDDGYIFMGDSQFNKEFVLEEDVYGVLSGYYQGKKYVDCNSDEYVNAIKDWYANPETRKNKIDKYYKKQSIKAKIKKVLTFGRK